jgi:hypothetical protein
MQRQVRVISVVWVVLFVANCVNSGSYALHLIFPDDEARSLVSQVTLSVLEPGGHSCEQLISGELAPDDLQNYVHATYDFPPRADTRVKLPGVPARSLLFFAEGRSEGCLLLRGCAGVQVKPESSLSVEISLVWVCKPNPEGEIRNNGLDDDCDGKTDECLLDKECDDGLPCTQDMCTLDTCYYTNFPNDLVCNDENVCTTIDKCRNGVCQGTAKDCSALDSTCMRGVCDPSTGNCRAEPEADGTTCDDGLFCTTGDSCRTGACAVVPRDCEEEVPNPCTRDLCNEGDGICYHALEPKPFQEGIGIGNSCGDSVDNDCDGKTDLGDPDCLSCSQPADCDDGNACTDDDCQGNQCVHTPKADGQLCDDGMYCTVGDQCRGGVCHSTSPRDCSQQADPCQEGICRESDGTCVFAAMADGVLCEDGLFCTIGDHCVAGFCNGQTQSCDDNNPCTLDGCNENLRRCENLPQQFPGREGPGGGPTCANNVDDDCDGKTDLEDPSCSGCIENNECDDYNPCTRDECVFGECQNTQIQGCEIGPVLYLKFDESSGTTAFDSSGFAHHGNLMNGPVWTSGKSGNALSFDGIDDHVDLGQILNALDTITISAWINPTINNKEQDIVNNGYQSTNTGYELGVTEQAELKFKTQPNSSSWTYWYSSGAAIATNSWQQVAVVYDGTTMTFYKNGALLNSFFAPGRLYPTTDHLRVGIYPYLLSYPFNGSIDELRIYNRTLSGTEISQIYSSTRSFFDNR